MHATTIAVFTLTLRERRLDFLRITVCTSEVAALGMCSELQSVDIINGFDEVHDDSTMWAGLVYIGLGKQGLEERLIPLTSECQKRINPNC